MAISPNVSSGPSRRTAPPGRRTSTSPSTTPYISVPSAPASKIGVPAGTSWKFLAFRNRPGSFIPVTSVASRVRPAQASSTDADADVPGQPYSSRAETTSSAFIMLSGVPGDRGQQHLSPEDPGLQTGEHSD